MGVRWNDILKGLPEDLLAKFNKMNQTAKQYTVNRILGFSKNDSLRNAGSNATSNSSLSSTVQNLEERNPQIEEIVNWGVEHSLEAQINNDNSAFAKSLEGKQAEAELAQLNHATSVMSPNMAESVEFYRKVAKGEIKTRKITERYDNEGKLIERKKETIEDVDAKMRAREKLDRLLGINAIQNLGQVQVGSISINIVDASKKEETEAEREVDFQEDVLIKDEIIVEQEPQFEIEIEKPKKPTSKEIKEQRMKEAENAYEKMLEKRAKREQKRKQA